MFLFHSSLIFCGIFGVFSTFCNVSNSGFYKRSHKVLDRNGDVFMVLSYATDDSVTHKPTSELRKFLDESQNQLTTPITMMHYEVPKTKNMSDVFAVRAIHGSFAFNSFKIAKEIHVDEKCTENKETIKIFVFQINETQTHQFMIFHACRAHNKSENSIIVEKVILVVIEGEFDETNETDIIEKVKKTMRNSSMKIFTFNEFNEKDFCICGELVSFLSECQKAKSINNVNIIWILVAFNILTVAITTAVKCYLSKLNKIDLA